MANQEKDKSVKSAEETKIVDIKAESKSKKKEYRSFIFNVFAKKLREDKLYAICFIITLIALGTFSLMKVRQADGVFTKSDDGVETITSKEENDKLDEALDVSEYVGFYVKNFKLNKKVSYGSECSFNSYEFIYEVKEDNTINKYISSDCMGTLLVSSDTLSYVKTQNTKNIGTKYDVFVFDSTKLTEVNGYTYKMNKKYKLETSDDTVSNLVFYDDKFVIMNLNSLYLINGKEVENEVVNSSLLAKSIYRSSKNKNTYRYIVYEKDMTDTCYDNAVISSPNFEDSKLYSVYSITFDLDEMTFGEPKLEYTRNKSAGCDSLNKDLTALSD